MSVEFEPRSASGCELVAEVARRFGEVRFRATGASMMPVVWPGDILTVRCCTLADLQPGHIVLYRQQGSLVAHRILRMKSGLVTTQGDSLRREDSPIRESDIVGQVVSLVRRGRPLATRLSPWGRIGSRILRRSDFCLRVAMRLALWRQRLDNKEVSWA